MTGRLELDHLDSGGGGTPLVLLHAFPLSRAMWTSQVTALAGDCRVITPDQRGFGGSPLGGDPPSLDVAADDLAALLDRLELDRVVLAGLSMGGYLAMAFLRRYPGRVGALGLLDTRAGADSPRPWRPKGRQPCSSTCCPRCWARPPGDLGPRSSRP